MKKFTKLLGIVLIIALVMSMGTMALAADPVQKNLTITINDGYDGHVFTAYQIFAGEVDSNTISAGTTKLSNISFGTGVNEAGLKTALYAISAVKTQMDTIVTATNAGRDDADKITYADLTAAQVAQAISDANLTSAADLKALSEAMANNKGSATGTPSTENKTPYTITGLDAGYYVVIDTSGTGAADDAFSNYMVNLVGNTTMTVKVTKTTSDKTVEDDKDSGTADDLTGGRTTVSQDAGYTYESADHALYETFKFTLKATIENDADNLAFYDTYKLVFHDTMSKGLSFLGNVSVTATNLKDGATIAYTLSDNVKNASSTAPVDAGDSGLEWTLTITDLKQYVSTLAGTVVTVTYDAYLNKDAKISSVADGTSTNSNDNTFYVQYSNNPNVEGLGNTTPDTVYVFTYDMPNTKYKDEVKSGNELAGAGFTVKQGTTALKFVPVTEDGTVVTEGVTEKDSDGKPTIPSTVKAYRLAKTGETGAIEQIASLSDGTFKLLGLDAGTYTLSETYTPAGFNTCEDITIVITGNTEETTTGGKATMSMKMNGESSTNNQIVNNSGTVLPSTGGIGTTIFYVVGSIMVVAAGVLLITKKRMGRE